MSRPTPGTFPAYFERYVNKVDAESATEAISKYSDAIEKFFVNIPSEKHLYKYDEDKWTVKEVVQHVIDTERIFAYRALRIARKDKTALPGFDENSFAKAATNTNVRSWEGLLEELSAVRKSTDLLLKSFTEEQFQESGITNGNPTTVNSIAYIIFGHILHHRQILEERYL